MEKNHPIHEVIGNDTVVLVCITCAAGVPNILIISTMPKGNIGRLYEYKTGKMIDKELIPGKKMSMKIWTSFDTVPDIVRTSQVFEVAKFWKINNPRMRFERDADEVDQCV